jgi:hypothetical protein
MGQGGCTGQGAGPMMSGPSWHMSGPMMGWGHMRGYYSRLTPEQMGQRQYMSDQYLWMQEMMLNHMMWRQHWMMAPPGAKQ